MVVLLKSEVLALQINDLKFKEKIAELEDERLRLLTCMTVGNLVREEEFELRDTSETFDNTENSPNLPTVPSFHHVMNGMESETYDFKRSKINFSLSDLEETLENRDDPMFLPPAAGYISDSDSESSNESQKNPFFENLLNDIISKIVEIPPKNAKN